MYSKEKLKAFSLVELIIAIGLFSVAISSFAFLGIEAYKSVRISQNRIAASQKAKEVADAIMIVKNESWANIVDNTDDQQKYILNTGGVLSIENGQKDEGNLTYFFTINPGYRDENGNLIEIEQQEFEDIGSRIINLTIIFDSKIFKDDEYNTKIYINNWNTLKLTQETYEDFEEGESDGTEVLEDGIIELVKMSLSDFPDWCTPQHTHSVLDMTFRSQRIFTNLNNVYAVRGLNSSDNVFSHVKINHPVSAHEKPTLEVIGSSRVSGGNNKSNNLYFHEGYVYTANPNEAQRSVWIIDVREEKSNYEIVGSYLVQGKPTTNTIYVHEINNLTYGFVGYNNKIDIFRIPEDKVNQTQVATITLNNSNAMIRDIVVKDQHIFAAVSNHSAPLVIISILDINNPQVIGQFNFSNTGATSIFVSEDSNITYIGTLASSTSPEFLIVNTINKSNPTLITSFETNGMNIRDLAIVENRAVLGGDGTNNYIVLNLDNFDSISKCGELTIEGNVLSLNLATFNNRLFTYVLTNNDKLQIIEGGLGLAAIGGDDYINYGEYFSKVFDSNTTTIRFYSTHIYGQQPPGTSLKVYLGIGNQPDLSDVTWFGPDGTEETFFGLGDNEINLPPQEGRYFQYKVIMTSDSIESSPVLDKIEIIYD